jgi:glycosyltransferase involved in cell wall biosynthesis
MSRSLKIVLVNYRYFISGGPERYYFNIKEVLENHGHLVIPFSIKGTKNLPTPYDHYFLSKVDDEAYFSQYKKTPVTFIKSFTRMFYSFEAKRKFGNLLIKEKPDIVYIMQYHNKISPSIIIAAKKLNIPVVHRISDFQYICANGLFHNDIVGVCEKCLTGSKWNAVRYKCVLNSRLYSFVKIAAQKLYEILKITEKIDAFIVPSAFTVSKLLQYGISPEKLNLVPTFFNHHLIDNKTEIVYKSFALYVGRIEKQKGLLTMIKAFENTNHHLKIIGFSNDGYEEFLKEYSSDKKNIEFLGRKKFDEIIPFLSSCLFSIVPSEIYDNFPNAVIESYAFQKPVIASNLGSLKELVLDAETGLLFEAGNSADLSSKLELLFSNPELCKKMGKNAITHLEESFSEDSHYLKLMEVLERVIKNRPTDSKFK